MFVEWCPVPSRTLCQSHCCAQKTMEEPNQYRLFLTHSQYACTLYKGRPVPRSNHRHSWHHSRAAHRFQKMPIMATPKVFSAPADTLQRPQIGRASCRESSEIL